MPLALNSGVVPFSPTIRVAIPEKLLTLKLASALAKFALSWPSLPLTPSSMWAPAPLEIRIVAAALLTTSVTTVRSAGHCPSFYKLRTAEATSARFDVVLALQCDAWNRIALARLKPTATLAST